MNFYPFHLGDYAAHTKHLTLLEDLAYRRMIDLYYTNESQLPLDPEKVARLIGMRDHMREVSDVLSDFFVKSENGYSNSRCEKEIAAYKAKADRAKSANKSRWSADKSDSPMKSDQISDVKSDADRIPTNNQEPITKNQEPLKTKEATPSALPDLFDGIDSQVVRDFKALRTKQKAPITKTAVDGIQREANKAGISLESALTMCCERGWRGFKAEWLGPRSSPSQGSTDLDAARKAANEEAKRRLFCNKNMEVFDG